MAILNYCTQLLNVKISKSAENIAVGDGTFAPNSEEGAGPAPGSICRRSTREKSRQN